MTLASGQTSIRVATTRTALARLRRWAPEGVWQVTGRLEERGHAAFLVGGAVRDAYLGRRFSDWDVATDLAPAKVAALFKRVVRAGEKHGTIMVLTDTGPVEVTTFRSEGPYLDGRRPSRVDFHQSLELDLARRDFTINAMAASLGGNAVVDPFGGIEDLRRRLVRCVGDAAARFAEDGLRPLRAVRFAGVLGFFVHRRTREALAGALPTFRMVAWERKRDELTRLLGEAAHLAPPLGLLQATGMLGELAPELVGVAPAQLRRLDRLPHGQPWLRFAGWAELAAVGPRDAAAVLRRWRVAGRHVRAVEMCLAALARLPEPALRGRELRSWVAEVGAEPAQLAALLAQTLWPQRFRGLTGRLRRLLAQQPPMRLEDLALGGEDLLTLGLQGPAVGATLRALLAAVVEDPRKNDRTTLLGLAHKLSTGRS